MKQFKADSSIAQSFTQSSSGRRPDSKLSLSSKCMNQSLVRMAYRDGREVSG